jgi:hypothetical protein
MSCITCQFFFDKIKFEGHKGLISKEEDKNIHLNNCKKIIWNYLL